MSEVKEILTSGPSARDETTLPVSEAELIETEEELGFHFPASYKEFLSLGGLAELRISHKVLSPVEIKESLKHLPSDQYIPFADNGCGDLYCWPKGDLAEPPVLFSDHEIGVFRKVSSSFTAWLKENRF